MTARYDLLIAPADGGHILPDAAARGFLRQLALRQLALPADEAVAREWVEIYFKPGEAAHLIFTEGGGAATGDGPPFLEAVFRFGSRRETPPFGESIPTGVAFELRGALHSDVPGTFRQLVAESWQMRVGVFSRPHASLPPHREVPEAERRPPAEQKESPTRGAVGVRIEEF